VNDIVIITEMKERAANWEARAERLSGAATRLKGRNPVVAQRCQQDAETLKKIALRTREDAEMLARYVGTS
jgi:hypothetical protein